MLNSLKVPFKTHFRSLKYSFTNQSIKKFFYFYITRSLNQTFTMSGREQCINRDLIKKHIIRLDLNNPNKDYNELIKCIGANLLLLLNCSFFFLYIYRQIISLQFVGNAQIVLIGEASHGTEEFYRERCLITQRLIEEKDFT
jgi:hypothetical protein